MNDLLCRSVGGNWGSVGRWGWGVGGLLVLAGSVVVVVEHLAVTLVAGTPLQLKDDWRKLDGSIPGLCFLYFLLFNTAHKGN